MKIPLDKFENWIRAKGFKERTIGEYLYYFNKFAIFEGFNQENVSRFISIKTNKNTVARSFLKNYQRFLMVNYKEFGIEKDQRIEISEVELPTLTGRIEKKIIKPITEEEIWKIEKEFDDEKEKLELLISYYAGLRLQEVITIKIISFNWDEWKKDISKVGTCKVYGKGSKEGTAFIPSWLMKRIAKYIRSKSFLSLASYIFLKKGEIEKVNFKTRGREWEKKLKKAGIKAGIIKLDNEGKIIEETDIWPHKLRHSWGYYLREVKGLDIRDIKEILRHSKIESTERYLYSDKEKLKDKVFENSENQPVFSSDPSNS